MSKLAIIDLDGVVCDSSARFAKAEEAKERYRRDMENNFIVNKQGEADAYWKMAFTPDLVQLDTLMDGVSDALSQLSRAGYRFCFLTSRPETMREATVTWFQRHYLFDYADNGRLIMKPLSQQYVKTPVWKAGTIEVLARLLQPDDLLVVDDEHAAQLTADLAHLDVMKLTCVASLQEAVAKIGA